MNTVVEITADQTAQAGIQKGQRAWSQIKATAEEQRSLWLDVGGALRAGKLKENRADGQKFSEWVQEKFEGLDHRPTIADAQWFAEFCTTLVQIPADLTHPVSIRQWHRDQQAFLANTDPVLKEAPAPTAAVALDKRVGERIVKLIHRKVSGDEGSDIAARALTAYAQQHGTSEAVLEAAAKAVAPDAYYRFAPNVQQQIDNWRDSVRMDISAMERTGLPREAIRSLLINLAHSL